MEPTARPTATDTATGTGGPTETTGSATGDGEPAGTDESTETVTPTPDPASFASWPSFMRNDENWGHHPEAVEPDGAVSVDWERDLGGSVEAAATLVNGRLFVGTAGRDGGAFYALDPTTGETLWERDLGAPVSSAATVANGFVYVGTDDGTLHALEARSGDGFWQFGLRSGEAVAPPVVVGGAVYAGTSVGQLYKFDALDSTQRWTRRVSGSVVVAPAYADGTLYVPSENAAVYAVSTTGEETWRNAVDDDGVGVSHRNRRVYATGGTTLEQTNVRGRRNWSTSVDAQFTTTPTVTATTVLAGTRTGAVHAFEADSGIERWRFAEPSGPVSAPAVVVDRTAYVGSEDGTVYAVGIADGEATWSLETGAAITAAPVVAGGRVFLGNDDGTLYALAN